MPRRHTNAGNRPRGPRSVNGLRQEFGLPSGAVSSVPRDNANARADETPRPESEGHGQSAVAASEGDADETQPGRVDEVTAIARTGVEPVNDRLPQTRPPARTARVHVPPPELGRDVVLVAGGLVRVQRRRFQELR